MVKVFDLLEDVKIDCPDCGAAEGEPCTYWCGSDETTGGIVRTHKIGRKTWDDGERY